MLTPTDPDLADTHAQVQLLAAARATGPDVRMGSDKVMLGAIMPAGTTAQDFARVLIALNRDGLIRMARLDLTRGTFDPALIARSSVRDAHSEWHFIVLPSRARHH